MNVKLTISTGIHAKAILPSAYVKLQQSPAGDSDTFSKWLNGSGAPAQALGRIGYYYLDNDTKYYYEKNQQGVWIVRGSLSGDVSASELTLMATAGQSISSGRAVVIRNGLLHYYDPTLHSDYGRIIGISITAGSIGNMINVQRYGIATMTGWGLTPDARYFATPNGQLSTTPNTLVTYPVGFAKTANDLFIQFFNPIINA